MYGITGVHFVTSRLRLYGQRAWLGLGARGRASYQHTASSISSKLLLDKHGRLMWAGPNFAREDQLHCKFLSERTAFIARNGPLDHFSHDTASPEREGLVTSNSYLELFVLK